MLKITSDHHVLTMSDKHSPVAHVSSGENVIFETLDCFSCKIKREDQLFSSVGWEHINPATGPLYVDGAQCGDILKVEILDIKLASYGVTATAPGLGVFGEQWNWEVTRIVPVHDGKVYFNEKIILEASPMIGVIGTAPANGNEIPTGTPGHHGGNMDCKLISSGSTIYLPVNVDGALLFMGDMHAAMGDGEVSGCGIEIAGEITVRVTVLRDIDMPVPMLVNKTHLITIFSALTLDEAAKGATIQLHKFLVDKMNIEPHEAAMLLSASADLRICQTVDPLITCRMELPLQIMEQYSCRIE